MMGAPVAAAFPAPAAPGLAQVVPTKYVNVNGAKIAYRRFGSKKGNPVVFLPQFRGTMDIADPLLFNYIAQFRPVVLFDNAGVGHSTGEVGDSVARATLRRGLRYCQQAQRFFRRDSKLVFYPSNTSTAAGIAWGGRISERNVTGETKTSFVQEPGTSRHRKAIVDFTRNSTYLEQAKKIRSPFLITSGTIDVLAPTTGDFYLQQNHSLRSSAYFPRLWPRTLV
ncbi:hypothetical protein T440DRAFT_484188 [Plenodomus tracheiphilus IPT5]|uniref:Alpha/beta hydrolase n=1 Tax=Plenodomus tracheiphilus IPT5 TaxID=1408161 RepID=A0A6A7AML3_9PLEO|nr:hypothetical protein T440DRAFT_484188 [Plenodomus tracheiphilus IPT5]